MLASRRLPLNAVFQGWRPGDLYRLVPGPKAYGSLGSLALHLLVLVLVLGIGLARHSNPGNNAGGLMITLVTDADLPQIVAPSRIVVPAPARAAISAPPVKSAHGSKGQAVVGPRAAPSQDGTAADAAPSALASEAVPVTVPTTPDAPQNGMGSQKSLGDDYLEGLRHWIEAHQGGQQGLQRHDGGWVKVKFTILHDGTIVDAAIIESSGVTSVDVASLDLLRRASPAPPLPDWITSYGVTISDTIHIWDLLGR